MTYPQFLRPLRPTNVPPCRCPVSRRDAAPRILIVKFGGLGDILMATPLLAALRRAYPEAHLSWLAEHSNLDAILANPHIDEIIAWDGGHLDSLLSQRWKEWFKKRRLLGLRWLANVLHVWHDLRRRRFDVLITFHPDQWPLLARGAGARTSIGVYESSLERDWVRLKHRSLYSDVFSGAILARHRTDRYLMPLPVLGLPAVADKRMTLGYTGGDAGEVDQFLGRHGVGPTDPLVVISPRTTWPSKNWPPERFAEVAEALASRDGCRIVLAGTGAEGDAVAAVAALMDTPPIQAAGALSFRQMGALIARASLVISSDTGPMHAAAALGTPYVALFGPTPALWLAPLAGRGVVLSHPVPCGPCSEEVCPNTGDDLMRCMRLITVKEVLKAARTLIGAEAVPA